MRGPRNIGKRGLRQLFEIGQRFGVDLLPRHFYSSIPDVKKLRRTQKWREPFDMRPVSGADLFAQIAFLEDLCPPSEANEWAIRDIHATASQENGQGGGYGVIEANVLYAFICRHRPKRVIQVGCGLSTSIILRAAGAAGYAPQIVCVDPYPSEFLLVAEAFKRITLYRQGAEECPRELLTDLNEGDLLFVDSTHAVKPGSEVNRIILDVLPRLAPGIFIHFHDIYFPYDYQRELLSNELFFSAESTLLHAFLVGNVRCRIVLCLSILHYAAPHRIKALIPTYDPQKNIDGLAGIGGSHFPSALYLLTTDHH